jgi:hypothetical protein
MIVSVRQLLAAAGSVSLTGTGMPQRLDKRVAC